MERFENTVREVFDYNRFDMHPEMKALIAEFEKKHPAAEKQSGTREQVSFSELEGSASSQKLTASHKKQPSTEREKGKS